MCIKINKIGKQEVGIWWIQKRFPRYGVPIIFLSNYWWQESDIWSQASYRYVILWEVFLDPSDSYFLFSDLVGFYTHWTYMHIFRHIFLKINKVGKQEIGIWWVQKRFPQYGVPIWRLWPNIRSLPSIVAEKNATVYRLSWFLYTLNIYAHFSSHFSQQLLMAEIWYLVTSVI
jgi:hypothetical protein